MQTLCPGDHLNSSFFEPIILTTRISGVGGDFDERFKD